MSPSQEEGEGRRKRTALELFDDSGLTEEQRRRIRHKQRSLHEKIEGGPEDVDQTKMEFLAKARDENNAIFHSVRFTREAVLDAENAGLIVEKMRLEVDKLRSVSPHTSHDPMFTFH